VIFLLTFNEYSIYSYMYLSTTSGSLMVSAHWLIYKLLIDGGRVCSEQKKIIIARLFATLCTMLCCIVKLWNTRYMFNCSLTT
jgi:hypothetical protein